MHGETVKFKQVLYKS